MAATDTEAFNRAYRAARRKGRGHGKATEEAEAATGKKAPAAKTPAADKADDASGGKAAKK